MTKALTYEEVLGALQQVVNEDPEAVRSCVYVKDGEPHCLAGRALHRLGVPVETLEAWDKELHNNINAVASRDDFPNMEYRARWLLHVAQREQDLQYLAEQAFAQAIHETTIEWQEWEEEA